MTSSPTSFSSVLWPVVVCSVVCLAGGWGAVGVAGWPGGSAMYECCCPEPYNCRRDCFMCRNVDFVCNCQSCSCYLDTGFAGGDAEDVVSRNDLLSTLFRTGAGKKSRNDRRYGTYGLGR